MGVFFILDLYILEDNLHALPPYPVDPSCCVSRDTSPRCSLYLMRFGIPAFTTAAFSARLENSPKQITQLFSLKTVASYSYHTTFFKHFKLKRNFNILLEHPIKVKFSNFHKKIHGILSIAI